MISNGVDPRMVCHYVAVIHVLCEAAADHPFSINQAERSGARYLEELTPKQTRVTS